MKEIFKVNPSYFKVHILVSSANPKAVEAVDVDWSVTVALHFVSPWRCTECACCRIVLLHCEELHGTSHQHGGTNGGGYTEPAEWGGATPAVLSKPTTEIRCGTQELWSKDHWRLPVYCSRWVETDESDGGCKPVCGALFCGLTVCNVWHCCAPPTAGRFVTPFWSVNLFTF